MGRQVWGLFLLFIFAGVASSCYADGDSFEITKFPYMKGEGYSSINYDKYKYIFKSGLLSEIDIKNYTNGVLATFEYYINRNDNVITVTDGTGITKMKIVHVGDELVITRTDSKNIFYITVDGNSLWCGIQKQQNDRLIHILGNENGYSFNFKPIGEKLFPYLDFSIDKNNGKGTIAYADNNIEIKPYAKDEYEMYFGQKDDVAPVCMYRVQSARDNFKITIADFFIDYFLGAGFEEPVITQILVDMWGWRKFGDFLF